MLLPEEVAVPDLKARSDARGQIELSGAADESLPRNCAAPNSREAADTAPHVCGPWHAAQQLFRHHLRCLVAAFPYQETNKPLRSCGTPLL